MSGANSAASPAGCDIDGDGVDDFVPERLEDWARERRLPFEGTPVDAACSDYDNDGSSDLFLLLWKKPGRLFRNAGSSLMDVTEQTGLEGVGGEGWSALFFDFDRDGDPDLLVTARAPMALSLRRLLSPERRATSLTPRLFENEGGKRFHEVTSEVGLDRHFGVVDATAFDADSDGFLDLVFAMGGLDASHHEPSIVLRNLEGKHFIEWAHIPSTDEPHRAIGVRIRGAGSVDPADPFELVVADPRGVE